MRSRISVGIIFLGPILLHAYILIPEIRTIPSTFIVTLIAISLSSLIIVFSRMHGSKSLMKCYPDGLPAQSYLMPKNDFLDEFTKQRYYGFFQGNLNGFEISNDDEKMKLQVSTAITWLISQTRNASQFPLIAEENMNLGFAYNLLGLKPFSLILCFSLIIIDSIFLLLPVCSQYVNNKSNLFFCLITTVLWLIIWILMINQKLVRNCGKKYARALLSACDSPFFNTKQ